MRGTAWSSASCCPPSAASACGRSWSRCLSCRRTSASRAAMRRFPYTLTMVGFGIASIVMGKMSDRYGIMTPVILGTVALGVGYIAAAWSGSLRQYALAHVPRGRRNCRDVRAAARAHVAVVRQAARHGARHLRERQLSRGHGVAARGRALHRDVRLARHLLSASRSSWSSTMLPLALLLRRPPPHVDAPGRGHEPRGHARNARTVAGLALQTLLVIAGVACCVAMSMPQVHLVAYCGDLGYGAGARRADALADAGVRHREPPHLRRHLRPHRRLAHAPHRIGAAGRCRCSCSCRSTASSRSS